MTPLGRFVRAQWQSSRLSAGVAFVIALAGTGIYFGRVVDAYPPVDWLSWTLAQLWFWLALFSLACASFGQFVLVRLLDLRRLPALESAVMSMAIGTVAFVLFMYLGGALGLYGTRFSIGLPLLMLVVGVPDGRHLLARLLADRPRRQSDPIVFAIWVFGVAGVLLAYLGILSPDVINCDAMMVHLKIPEEYARTGAITAFPANYQTTVPHLASILYTWTYLVPGLQKAQHWMLALHLEFSLFLWTLAGVSAAVRRIAGRPELSVAWASIFLFPGLYVADSNMAGCADHVLAFFSVPVALATLLVCHTFSRSSCVLLGITLAGAILTKYQAVYLIGAVGVVVGIAWISAVWRLSNSKVSAGSGPQKRDVMLAPIVIGAVTFLLFSPHLIKNTIFYGNPVYPFQQSLFPTSTPKFPGVLLHVDNLFKDVTWVPKGTLIERLTHAARLFFTFSFEPHYSSRTSPYFGSLFTLMLPMLFVGRLRRDELRVAAIGAISLLMWALTFNVDRNLQTFMPVLATVTASLIVKTWQRGWLARLGVAPLVIFQVAWGADAALDGAGRARISQAVELMASGLEGKAAKRFDGYRASYLALTNAVPANARILLHLAHDTLGIDREVWLDRPGFQGLISYRDLRTPRELYEYYRNKGISHLILDAREPNPAAQRDELLVRLLANRHSSSVGTFGSYHLIRLSDKPPPAEAPYRALSIGVTGYRDGLYPIEKMGTIEYLPPAVRIYGAPERAVGEADWAAALGDVDAVLIQARHPTSAAFQQALSASFEQFTTWGGGCTVFVRRRR